MLLNNEYYHNSINYLHYSVYVLNIYISNWSYPCHLFFETHLVKEMKTHGIADTTSILSVFVTGTNLAF